MGNHFFEEFGSCLLVRELLEFRSGSSFSIRLLWFTGVYVLLWVFVFCYGSLCERNNRVSRGVDRVLSDVWLFVRFHVLFGLRF